MPKLLVWSGIATVVIVVAGLVYVTFQNDIKKVLPQPTVTSGSSPPPAGGSTPLAPAPSGGSVSLESLVNTQSSGQGYVLAMAKAKIYIRGQVDKWSGQTLTVRIGANSSPVSVTNPVKVLCQPATITDQAGNPIQSSDVFIDLTNYTGTPPSVALDKVKPAFTSGTQIAFTAAKQGDGYQVDILVGFGCNL